MKKMIGLLACLLAFILSGCGSVLDTMLDAGADIEARALAREKSRKQQADVQSVKILKTKPARKYTVIGKVTVDTTVFDEARSEDDIRGETKMKAADMGGHAVINVKRTSSAQTGTVIRYTGR